VNVQLIDGSRGNHIWADRFDRSIDGVFQIQDEIIETIVSTVTGQIRNMETGRSRARATDNLSAYDHLLRGLHYHRNGYMSFENFRRARKEFQKAIDIDPEFARARAWVVCADAALWVEKNDAVIDKAIDDAKFALSLDEKESESHRILGSLYLYARNYDLSGYHYEEARRLSPNDAHIAVRVGRYYAYTGQVVAAMETVKRAMRLNPLHPGWYWQELGIIHYSMDNFSQALIAFDRNWEQGSFDLALVAATCIAMGEREDAADAAAGALELDPKSAAGLFVGFETFQDRSRHRLLHDRMVAAGIPA
jgi:adenylate cyclase